MLLYRQQSKGQKKETLLSCLADLFYTVTTKKKKVGQIPPKKFVQRLKRENGNAPFRINWLQFIAIFDNYLPQDAHEFLNYLLNRIADILQGK